jgi:hypothetical protein
MKLAVVVGGACGICHVAAGEHVRCGVCECSNQILKVCSFCQAWNKAEGVDWNAKAFDNGDGRERSRATSTQRRAQRPLRDEQAPTRRRGRPRDARIDDAVLPRLLCRRIRVKVLRRGRNGRSRGTYEVWEWSSRRLIARQEGCSHGSVDRRYHDYDRVQSSRFLVQVLVRRLPHS